MLKIGHPEKAITHARSLCKMVSLDQDVKVPKTWENPFYKSIRVVQCKKQVQKSLNIREIRLYSLCFLNSNFIRIYLPSYIL